MTTIEDIVTHWVVLLLDWLWWRTTSSSVEEEEEEEEGLTMQTRAKLRFNRIRKKVKVPQKHIRDSVKRHEPNRGALLTEITTRSFI